MTFQAPASPRKPRIGLAIFMAFMTLIFSGLGVWQIERLFWKLDLIARVAARVSAPAVPAPGPSEWKSVSADNAEYRRVTVNGTFQNDREVLVQAVTERGPGFWVVTPLLTSDRGTILINRGFVPQEKRDPASRSEGQPTGTVTVTGLLRITEPGGAFLRSNDPANGRWYSRDVQAIAKQQALSNTAPYFIDADATPNPGGYPVGGLTVIQFRNSHLVYALTWFGLAIMSLAAASYLWRRRNRIATTEE